MKRKVVYIISILLCFFVLTACNRKLHAIDKLDGFVEKVEKNASRYSEKDWDKSDAEFNELLKDIDQYEYTREEKERIAKIKGRYAGIRTKNAIHQFIEGIGDAVNEIQSTIEGFTEGVMSGDESQKE